MQGSGVYVVIRAASEREIVTALHLYDTTAGRRDAFCSRMLIDSEVFCEVDIALRKKCT